MLIEAIWSLIQAFRRAADNTPTITKVASAFTHVAIITSETPDTITRQHLHCSQRVEAGQLRCGSQVPLERVSKGICGSILTPILLTRGPADPTQVLLPVTIATDKNYERCSGRNPIRLLTSSPPPPFHIQPLDRRRQPASAPAHASAGKQRSACVVAVVKHVSCATQLNITVSNVLSGVDYKAYLYGSYSKVRVRACSLSRQIQYFFPQLWPLTNVRRFQSKTSTRARPTPTRLCLSLAMEAAASCCSATSRAAIWCLCAW